MGNQKTIKTGCEKSKLAVNIPVTVSLLVPVEIDYECVIPTEVDDALDIPILSLDTMDDGAEILDKAVEAMKNSEIAQDALVHLLAGAHQFKRLHPEIVGKYSIFLGVADEETF